jgi:hypothetical protein
VENARRPAQLLGDHDLLAPVDVALEELFCARATV